MAVVVTLHRPGDPPRELRLEAGASTEVPGVVRLDGCEAPGVVVEGRGPAIRVDGRRLARGERRLLRPGRVAIAGGIRITVAWEEPGTVARARAMLRSALGGEPPWAGPELVAISGPSAGRRFRLRSGVLGRGARASVRIEDPTVSRRHARLEVDGAAVRVVDLGSRNGSFVGGSRVSVARGLAPGEELRAGRTVLALGLSPPPEAAAEPRDPGRSSRTRRAMTLAVAALAAAALALLASCA